MKRIVLISCILSLLLRAVNSSSAYDTLKKCYDSTNIFQCFKIETLKVVNKALKLNSIKIADGISLTKAESNFTRSFREESIIQVDVNKLNAEEINNRLISALVQFVTTRKLKINMGILSEEARGKKKGGQGEILVSAMTGLTTILVTLAFKGIAAMSGAALLIGKMALVIGSVIGLKSLLSHEQTTFEFVKHKHHSPDQSYYKSLSTGEDTIQEKMYRGYLPHS